MTEPLIVGVQGTQTASTEVPHALVIRGLSKVFPGTQALKDIDLDVRYGEVHALCGGNGCGKSTLIKILSGFGPADAGTVKIGGHQLEASDLDAKTSYELGFRVVHQDPPLYPDLSVAENIALGARYPTTPSGRVSWRKVKQRAEELIQRYGIQTTAETLVRDLPVSVRTQVAIATALQDVDAKPCVVALDEPTAALPAAEVQVLLAAMRSLAALGHAILFVSHRLDEVLAATDRVTVMRDGRVYRDHRTSSLTEAELIESIVGRTAAELEPRRSQASASGDPILTVTNLGAGPVRHVTFEVRRGEVLGVAGLLGSGRTELLRALYGGLKKDEGEIKLEGNVANFNSMDQAIRAGVVMIPEDRPRAGAFLDMTVDENMDVSVLGRYWKGLGFRRESMRRDAEVLRTRFGVKAASGASPMRTLSGGNQQKAILARWLRREETSILLLDEPTQGVDVGARSDIYALVRQVTANGAAAIVVSSDFEELAQFVDRAVILRNGRLTASVPSDELTAHRLNELVHMKSGDNND
ncbi:MULTISPECIES: sugar ABC transporter ATP-binding protein [unclassified Arthrobacter]|uniref:sugar ABC transporter ATP-binding protein n=1 Tax=unclassified Arthrobacter TaxID=235627 RepID=UPI002882EBD2|nr:MULTISPECIES: sugar ABC transporter ATP-binding protein [unclassified Arthrobacter]